MTSGDLAGPERQSIIYVEDKRSQALMDSADVWPPVKQAEMYLEERLLQALILSLAKLSVERKRVDVRKNVFIFFSESSVVINKFNLICLWLYKLKMKK